MQRSRVPPRSATRLPAGHGAASRPRPRAVTALALRRPIPLFALAALASVVASLCIGAFPVGFGQILSAIGLSSTPLDDTTAAVLYAIRAPRVFAAFAVGAALAAGGAAMQSLFRNPLADPGLLGVSSGAALAAVSTIVLGERVMHIVPSELRPWCLPIAAFLGGLAATIVISIVATVLAFFALTWSLQRVLNLSMLVRSWVILWLM